MSEKINSISEYLKLTDMTSIESAVDKVKECEYFLNLAELETDRPQFRWLISAFLNAAYGYFEMQTMHAHFAFSNPQSGDPIIDSDALSILMQYIDYHQNPKKPKIINTKGVHPITIKLYDLRKSNTHHWPLSIMETGKNLPEDFHFGRVKGFGQPVLKFSREVLILIKGIQASLLE